METKIAFHGRTNIENMTEVIGSYKVRIRNGLFFVKHMDIESDNMD